MKNPLLSATDQDRDSGQAWLAQGMSNLNESPQSNFCLILRISQVHDEHGRLEISFVFKSFHDQAHI